MDAADCDAAVNPIERGVRAVDRWQQRHAVPAFVFAVVKKFGDDQAGNLAALLSYYAFLAVFPLLLALVALAGIVLSGHPALEQRIIDSALSEFPLVGTQLHSQLGLESLHHSGPALVIGIAGALYGARGLANAVQNTLNSLWQVPKVDRPGFPLNYLRSLALLALLGIGAVLTAAVVAAANLTTVFGLSGWPIRLTAFVLSTVLDAGLFLAAFRLATAKTISTRNMLLGAVLSAVAWQILLAVAGLIVSHYLAHAQAIAGLFGTVLGLLAWLALQATVTVYAVEADIVRARRLWPRSITQPPLTGADKDYLHTAATTETRRPEQRVTVEFTPAADQPPPN
ncbi:MAG TPA: YihY/virulence factor BrkB family protein [Mycobacteriales bacterium]|nr:YihY/virulence factor BrkB family protein [Mycobacteriales bacterium]